MTTLGERRGCGALPASLAAFGEQRPSNDPPAEPKASVETAQVISKAHLGLNRKALVPERALAVSSGTLVVGQFKEILRLVSLPAPTLPPIKCDTNDVPDLHKTAITHLPF